MRWLPARTRWAARCVAGCGLVQWPHRRGLVLVCVGGERFSMRYVVHRARERNQWYKMAGGLRLGGGYAFRAFAFR